MGLLVAVQDIGSQEQWRFWKLASPDNVRPLLQHAMGRLSRGQWVTLREADDEIRGIMSELWRLFYVDKGGLASMQAADASPMTLDEAPEREQTMHRLELRPQLKRVSHKRQVKMTQLADTLDMGVVLMYQPSKSELRRAGLSSDASAHGQVYHTLDSVQKGRLTTPTEKFVRFGLAPLIPRGVRRWSLPSTDAPVRLVLLPTTAPTASLSASS